MSLRSSRSGWQLASSTVPVSTAFATTASMSIGFGGPAADQPPRGVAEDVDVRVLERGTDALGLVGGREPV